MAAVKDNRFTDLKARLAALNWELLEEEGDHPERYAILDETKGLIVSNGTTIENQYDWVIERESAERGDDRETIDDVKRDTAEVLAMHRPEGERCETTA